jgi:hypothetical protein
LNSATLRLRVDTAAAEIAELEARRIAFRALGKRLVRVLAEISAQQAYRDVNIVDAESPGCPPMSNFL